MKRLKQLLVICAVAVGLAGPMLAVPNAAAVNVFDQCSGSNASSEVCKAKNSDNATSMIRIVINILLFVLGIIAVIMIVIGGIRYTTSNGDPAGVKSGKETVIYAVVGLVVAILSYSIVNFVVSRF